MPFKQKLKQLNLYDKTCENISCNILSINYKAPITIDIKDQQVSWSNPAAYIYSSLLNNIENKINLNTIEPQNLAEKHKSFIEQEEGNMSEQIIYEAIKQMFEDSSIKNELIELLLSSGNTKIIYLSTSKMLGNGDPYNKEATIGQNILGKCYMKYRHELKQNNDKELVAKRKLDIENAMYEAYEFYMFCKNILLNKQKYDEFISTASLLNKKEPLSDASVTELRRKFVTNKSKESGILMDKQELYKNYMNNTLDPGIIASINNVNTKSENQINYPEIIKIVKKDWLSTYVNDIIVIRNKDVLDAYVRYIITEYFKIESSFGKIQDMDQIIKDMCEKQSYLLNSEPNVCKNKIPDRLCELYKSHKNRLHQFTHSDQKFIDFMVIIEPIIEKYKNILPEDLYIKNSVNFDYSHYLQINLFSEQFTKDDTIDTTTNSYITMTQNLLIDDDDTTFNKESYKLSPLYDNGFVINSLAYPNICAYYFVKMFEFINYNTDQNCYSLIKKNSGFKSCTELSEIYDKNYREIAETKIAKAIVRILNIKFTGCEIACAALDALLATDATSIIWRSENPILGINSEGEGKNLVGLYLMSIKNSMNKTQKRAGITYNKLNSPKKVAELFATNNERQLLVTCINKFKYQLNLFKKFLELFGIQVTDDQHHYNIWCKKFITLLFYRCDILHLLINEQIENKQIPKIFKDKLYDKLDENDNLVQWFWGYYILVVSNVTNEELKLATTLTSFQKVDYETYKENTIEYIIKFTMTIISVLYYIITVYINTTSDYDIDFNYSDVIKFIKFMLYKRDNVETANLNEVEPRVENACEDFFKECNDKIGSNLTEKNQNEFKVLFQTILTPPENLKLIKTHPPILFFNNPKFMFDRDNKLINI